MTQRFVGPALVVLALAAFSTGSSPMHGQAQGSVSISNHPPIVVCAPCAGEAFGLSGQGMVFLNQNNLYFYPLDRAEARMVGLGSPVQLTTAPKHIGRLQVGNPLVWTQDGR
jgi:hypothetical protein